MDIRVFLTHIMYQLQVTTKLFELHVPNFKISRSINYQSLAHICTGALNAYLLCMQNHKDWCMNLDMTCMQEVLICTSRRLIQLCSDFSRSLHHQRDFTKHWIQLHNTYTIAYLHVLHDWAEEFEWEYEGINSVHIYNQRSTAREVLNSSHQSFNN